jgi:hypothetical protein
VNPFVRRQLAGPPRYRRSSALLKRAAAFASAFVLAGCASLSPDGGSADVQTLVGNNPLMAGSARPARARRDFAKERRCAARQAARCRGRRAHRASQQPARAGRLCHAADQRCRPRAGREPAEPGALVQPPRARPRARVRADAELQRDRARHAAVAGALGRPAARGRQAAGSAKRAAAGRRHAPRVGARGVGAAERGVPARCEGSRRSRRRACAPHGPDRQLERAAAHARTAAAGRRGSATRARRADRRCHARAAHAAARPSWRAHRLHAARSPAPAAAVRTRPR